MQGRFISTSDNFAIHTVKRSAMDARGSLLIIHGLHDHAGRYDHVANYFVQRGLSTLQFDLRGNGRSDGTRGYIRKFDDHLVDLETVIDKVLIDMPQPHFVFAHSMGALITAHYLLANKHPFKGAIFSGGLFKVNDELSPLLQRMSGIMAVLLPKLPTVKLDVDSLSRDPSIAERAKGDELHYQGGVRARTGDEVLKATARIEKQMQRLTIPMLILHGEADPLTKHEASDLLYARSASEDKTLKIYEGARHEIFNEIDRDEVFADIHSWIMARC